MPAINRVEMTAAPSLQDNFLASLASRLPDDPGVQVTPAAAAVTLVASDPTSAVDSVLKTIHPQAYVVAASYTVGVKVGPFEVGTKILIAALPPAAKVESGNIVGAVQDSNFFISITPPGVRSPIVGTYNPSTQSIEWGRGKVRPLFTGSAVFFENARGGMTGSTGSAQASVNAGVLLKIPGSRALSGALSNVVNGGTRLMETGELLSTLGGATPSVVAEESVRKVVADTLASGNFYAGVAYRADVSANGQALTLKGPGGNKVSVTPEQLVAQGLRHFSFDNRNFGVDEIAVGKMQYLLSRGSSYEQLSPVSGGKNYGDPALQAINTINAWGRRFAVLDSRVGNQTDMSNPSRPRYVKLWQSVRSGDEAVKVVAQLKSQLTPDQWKTLVGELRPATTRLGVAFGQRDLAGGAPRTPQDAQSAQFLGRDFHKDSRPQEFREIVTQANPGGKNHLIP